MKQFLNSPTGVILHKKVKTICGDYENKYFYVISFEENPNKNIDDEQNNFIDKYTIVYYDLLNDDDCQNYDDVQENKYPLYNAYSIVIIHNISYGDNLTVRIGNASAWYAGLDFIIKEPNRSIGIGSIIINHLIYWGKIKYPKLKKPFIRFGPVDEGKDNIERRNKLYYNVGLTNEKTTLLSTLTPNLSKRGFEVISTQKFINEIIAEKNSLLRTIAAKESCIKNLEDREKDFWSFNFFLRRIPNFLFLAFISIIDIPLKLFYKIIDIINKKKFPNL